MVLKLQTCLSQNVLFIGCSILSEVMVIYLSWYLRPKHVSWSFNIYHLTFVDEIVRLLILHIWNHLPKTLKAESSFQTFKRSLSDWLGPKCQRKVSSYLDNYPIVLLGSKPNLQVLVLICINLIFYCTFWTFRSILSYTVSF